MLTLRQQPLTNIDPFPIVQFIIYAIVNTPINCLWQDFLESTFPSSPPKPKGEQEKKHSESKLNIRNTLLKFGIDQTLGAAFNIPLFIATLGFVKNHGVQTILASIQNEFWPIYKAGLKLWPAVSIISFAALPVEKRVIFGGLAGVAWNVYLSLVTK